MVAQMQQEYVVRYGGVDTAAVDLSEFVPPLGRFLVGILDGVTAAIGGWRRIGGGAEHTVEIKRMYVAPAFRGRGLSRRMLAELERSAADAEARRIVLITGDRHVEAITLYESPRSGTPRASRARTHFGPFEKGGNHARPGSAS